MFIASRPRSGNVPSACVVLRRWTRRVEKEIKGLAQDLCPNVSMTLYWSDAFAIVEYGR
jgi:hypothetical protein